MTVEQEAVKSRARPRLVLVCGPWSSGTTAVSGMLDQLGLDGLGPYFQTNDERTKNSFESRAFRELVLSLAAEDKVALTAKRPAALAALAGFRDRLVAGELGPYDPARPIFLKFPLSALLIPEICQVFDTRLVYVLRPLREIEATRERRHWGAHLGALGARRLYLAMFDVLVNLPVPTLLVRYPELLARPLPYARQLAEFCGLEADKALIEKAAGFIRRPGQ